MKRTIITVTLSLTIMTIMSQNLMHVNTIAECEGEVNGRMTIAMDGSDPIYDPLWTAPYLIDYTNTTTGRNGTLQLNGWIGQFLGMEAGDYILTIELDETCEFEFTATIPLSTEISISGPSFYSPSDCDAADGMIWYRFGGPSGGIPPYAYYWTDELGNLITGHTPTMDWRLENVAQGIYYFHITDAFNCERIYPLEMWHNYSPMILEPIHLFHTCDGLANGEIGIAVAPSGQGLISNYSFVWSNGFQETGPTSYQTMLAAGAYSVTITDVAYPTCDLIETYTIINGMSSSMSLSYTTINNCPNTYNGQVDMQVSGGAHPYFLT